MDEWLASDSDFDQFFQIGDDVDAEVYDYFLNILPPATWNAYMLQIGSIDHHDEDGKACYTTFIRDTSHGVWRYVGTCYKGKSTHIPAIDYGGVGR
jgi:hypothetical protein